MWKGSAPPQGPNGENNALMPCDQKQPPCSQRMERRGGGEKKGCGLGKMAHQVGGCQSGKHVVKQRHPGNPS